MKVIAFSPCHITAFFEVCFSDDVYKTGSRGAGLCISLGSYATVSFGNGKKLGKVTEDAIKNLVRDEINFDIIIKNDLPSSQGFGISASSSLASTMAIAHLLKIPYEEALKAVHLAEIKNKTGLGDAIASFYGGMEMRIEPGITGRIKKIDCKEKLIVAIIGEKIETKKVLRNDKLINKINEIGNECLKDFIKKPSIDNLFDLSLKFAIETGIANEKMKKILKEANKIGKASMVMLGNSIFALYSKEMKKFLSKYKHYECFIDNEGSRILLSII